MTTARRHRIGPHRRVPRRHPQRSGGCRRIGRRRRAAGPCRRGRRQTRCHTSRFGRGAAGVGRRRRRRLGRHARACGTDPGRRTPGTADVLREAHRRDRRRERPGGRGDRPLGGAGAGRLSAAVRCRVRRRQARGRRRLARPAAHRAQHDDGPGATADGLHRGLRRHLPGLRRARLRRAALDHRAARRRGVCHRQCAGRSALRRSRRRGYRRGAGHLRAGHARRGIRGTLQRPWLRLPAGGARLPRHRGRRLGPRRSDAKRGPAQRFSCRSAITTSSWTASPTHSAPS